MVLISYDNASTGLFTHIGKPIKHYNLFATDNTNLAADRDEIFNAYQLGDQDTALDGLVGLYAGFEAEYLGRRAALVQFVTARLRDRTTVLEGIDAGSDDLITVMERLIAAMLTDSETVDSATTITAGTPSAGGSNVGTGVALATKVMDGVTSPGARHGVPFPANSNYNGVDSEFLLSEVLTLECVSDSYQDGLTEGSEEWILRGDIENGSPHDVETAYSGEPGGITTMANEGLIDNPDFEDFTTNAPDNWDIDNGAAGTDILKEVVAANVNHGSAALEFVGDGAQATIGISQSIDPSRLTANRMYHVQCWVKGTAGTLAGDLTIQFEGTGYTAGATEKIALSETELSAQTSFGIESFFIVMPSAIPSDWELVIKVETTLTSGKSVWIDDIQFAPVDYLAGFGVAVGRGATPWEVGDLFTITNVLTAPGVFQKFFTNVLGYQLPSNNAGAETILDSLAE